MSWSVSADELEALREIRKSSDRAAAILSACILEDRIESAIEAKLIHNTKVKKPLFGVKGALSPFAAKNDLAFLLRCYGPRFHGELRLINEIRNKFAHHFVVKGNPISDFNSAGIADRCRQLTLLESYIMTTKEFKKNMEQGSLLQKFQRALHGPTI